MSPQTTIPSETWITVHEAAALLQLMPATVIRRIQSGKLIGRCNAPMSTNFETDYSVLLNALPYPLQQQYGETQLEDHQRLSLDILSIRESKGNRSEEHFLKCLHMFQEAAHIRRTHAQDGAVTKHLHELACKHGISLRTLYRYEASPEAQAATPLWLDPIYLAAHMPKTMCLLAIDLIYALWLDPDHRLTQNAILRQVQSIAAETQCKYCPYRTDSTVRAKALNSLSDTFPECQLTKEHMLAPVNRHALNRLLAHVPLQQVCYCREGVRAWRSRFGHFTVREKPLKVNACFQGDHHVFDLFVDHTMPDRQGKHSTIYCALC